MSDNITTVTIHAAAAIITFEAEDDTRIADQATHTPLRNIKRDRPGTVGAT